MTCCRSSSLIWETRNYFSHVYMGAEVVGEKKICVLLKANADVPMTWWLGEKGVHDVVDAG